MNLVQKFILIMKHTIFIIALIGISWAMNVEDLKKMTDMILTGINITEPHKPLVECLDPQIAEDWMAMSELLHDTDWNNLETLIMRFMEFNMPIFSSLKSMLPCSKEPEAINIVKNKIDETLSNFGELANRIMKNHKNFVS